VVRSLSAYPAFALLQQAGVVSVRLMKTHANPLITRLELEREAAQVRSHRLMKIGNATKDYVISIACVEMAFAEQQAVKLMQDAIKFLKES
jgi:hypothetical protein